MRKGHRFLVFAVWKVSSAEKGFGKDEVGACGYDKDEVGRVHAVMARMK